MIQFQFVVFGKNTSAYDPQLLIGDLMYAFVTYVITIGRIL